MNSLHCEFDWLSAMIGRSRYYLIPPYMTGNFVAALLAQLKPFTEYQNKRVYLVYIIIIVSTVGLLRGSTRVYYCVWWVLRGLTAWGVGYSAPYACYLPYPRNDWSLNI